MLLAVSSFFNPGGLLAERQPFAGLRMKIVTQARKFVAGRDAIQSQVRRTLAEPLAGDGLPLGVVIADGQMLFEVFFRVVQVALCLGGQHRSGLVSGRQICELSRLSFRRHHLPILLPGFAGVFVIPMLADEQRRA